jgi:hypothetical protein
MFKTAFAVIGLTLAAAPAAAASYLPVGPQTNVAVATLTGGGWTQCLSESYGTYGTSISGTLAGCTGSRLLLAGRETGSSTILLLAQALREDVLLDTGTGTNATHLANGSQWYFNQSYSWGFANGGDSTFRTSCDASGVFDSNTSGNDLRLCWHTGGGALQGGWRVGANAFLNGSTAYERQIYSFNGVPEASTWAMLIVGFGMVGFGLRRRSTAAA